MGVEAAAATGTEGGADGKRAPPNPLELIDPRTAPDEDGLLAPEGGTGGNIFANDEAAQLAAEEAQESDAGGGDGGPLRNKPSQQHRPPPPYPTDPNAPLKTEGPALP